MTINILRLHTFCRQFTSPRTWNDTRMIYYKITVYAINLLFVSYTIARLLSIKLHLICYTHNNIEPLNEITQLFNLPTKIAPNCCIINIALYYRHVTCLSPTWYYFKCRVVVCVRASKNRSNACDGVFSILNMRCYFR